MKIEAAVLPGVGLPFERASLELDEPAAAEVRVKLAVAGVCASDAHTQSGRIRSPTPCVLGHEGAGVVESVGEGVSHVAVGDHVALSWMPSCGRCRYCRRGRPVLCTAAALALLAGTLLDGTVRLHRGGDPVHHYSFLSTFASYTVVPAASAIPIPADVPLALASIAGCAVLTGYGAVVNQARVRPGSSVVVFGGGGVGLSAVVGARFSGAAQIIVVDPVASKRTAAATLGATHTLAPSETLVHQIRELTGGDGADYAIDAAGGEGVVAQAFDATVAGGTVVCVGVPAPGVDPALPGARLVRDEKTVVGSLYGSSRPALDIPALLDLYMAGLLPLDRLVTKAFDLGDINTAFDELRTGTLVKGVLVIDPDLAGQLPVGTGTLRGVHWPAVELSAERTPGTSGPTSTRQAMRMHPDLDGKLAQGWGGAAPNGVHVNVLTARRGTATAAVIATAFTSPRPGFTPILASLGPDQASYETLNPPTVIVNKTEPPGPFGVNLISGASQVGISQAVLDTVADGLLPADQETVVLVSVWIDPSADDETHVKHNARTATRSALAEAVNGRDPRAVERLVDTRDALTHPFYGGA